MIPTPASSASPVGSMKVLSFALTVAVVVVAVAVVLSFPDRDGSPGVLAAACVALVVLGVLAAETVGLSTPPYPAGASPDPRERANESLARFRELCIRRFVMVEAPFILTIALTFVVADEGPWPVVVAAVPTVLGILLVTWPGRRNVGKVTERLEREGGRSLLPDALGLV